MAAVAWKGTYISRIFPTRTEQNKTKSIKWRKVHKPYVWCKTTRAQTYIQINIRCRHLLPDAHTYTRSWYRFTWGVHITLDGLTRWNSKIMNIQTYSMNQNMNLLPTEKYFNIFISYSLKALITTYSLAHSKILNTF